MIKLRDIPIRSIIIQIRYNAYLVNFPTHTVFLVLTMNVLCLLHTTKPGEHP